MERVGYSRTASVQRTDRRDGEGPAGGAWAFRPRTRPTPAGFARLFLVSGAGSLADSRGSAARPHRSASIRQLSPLLAETSKDMMRPQQAWRSACQGNGRVVK